MPCTTFTAVTGPGGVVSRGRGDERLAETSGSPRGRGEQQAEAPGAGLGRLVDRREVAVLVESPETVTKSCRPGAGLDPHDAVRARAHLTWSTTVPGTGPTPVPCEPAGSWCQVVRGPQRDRPLSGQGGRQADAEQHGDAPARAEKR